MMKRLLKFVSSIIIFTALVIACSNDSESTEGSIKILLTDAPFPTEFVAEANITIDRIEIRQTGVDDDSNPFITLTTEEMPFNLLDLTNGITASLLDMEVPVGSYDLIRLHIKEASIVLTNDQTFDLTIPSGAQTGIKVFIEPSIDVQGGLTSELLLDFDVSRSFVVQGNQDTPAGINGFHFKPVIKGSNLSTSGRFTGTVTDSLDVAAIGAQVSVYSADTVYTSTFADSLGRYSILGITAGTYDLKFEYLQYLPVLVEDIVITAGNATSQDIKLTE